jgi:hypothetical protein
MSKSGGGSESNKRVAVEEGGDSTDGPGKLKKSKTTAIDYDAAYKNLNGRLKKNGISTDHTKALDDTSKQVLQSCIQDPNQR